jgi:hypothetical protein
MEPRKPRPLGRGFFTFYILLTTYYFLLEFLLPFTPACISYAESIAGRQYTNSKLQYTNYKQIPSSKLQDPNKLGTLNLVL